MRIRILAAALSLAAAPLAAQSPQTALIQGRVLDRATGGPLAQVKLELPGHGSAYTGADGRFVLPRLRPGRHALNVRLIGYYEQRLTIGVTRDDSLVFRLEPEPVMLDALRVYGDRLAERATRDSHAARAYGLDRLKVMPSGSVLDFLKLDGGLHLRPCTDAGGGEGCVWSRGMPNPITVYIDGLEALGGVTELGELPVQEVFHVNVMSGGEVIEVFTRRFALEDAHRPLMHLRGSVGTQGRVQLTSQPQTMGP